MFGWLLGSLFLIGFLKAHSKYLYSWFNYRNEVDEEFSDEEISDEDEEFSDETVCCIMSSQSHKSEPYGMVIGGNRTGYYSCISAAQGGLLELAGN